MSTDLVIPAMFTDETLQAERAKLQRRRSELNRKIGELTKQKQQDHETTMARIRASLKETAVPVPRGCSTCLNNNSRSCTYAGKNKPVMVCGRYNRGPYG